MSKKSGNHKALVGQTAELKAAMYFSERGCMINWPRSLKQQGYDFIAEQGGGVAKVQVKGGSTFTKGGTPVVSCNGVQPKRCDVVFVYHTETKQARMFPSNKCPIKVSFPKVSISIFDV